MLRASNSFVSSLSALALVPCMLVASPAMAFSADGEKSAVLGLDGDADIAGSLTNSLRRELEKRGIQGDKQMTLVELKLTMGCDDDDEACIAEGGKTLEVEQLIYGAVAVDGEDVTIKLNVLDVAKGKITNGLTSTVAKGDVDPTKVDKTATDLVNRLLGPDPSAEAPAPAPVPEGPAETEEEPEEKSGGIVWGLQKPVPKWKAVGLGVSGGLFVASLATAIGTTLAIRSNGPVRKELIQTANDSLDDDKPENNIDPDIDGNLCEEARKEPNPDEEPGAVTNAEVTKVCNKADGLATAASITWATTAVFGLTTAVFTVLLFANKEKPAAEAMRKRDLQLGAAPTRDGGVLVGGGFRF